MQTMVEYWPVLLPALWTTIWMTCVTIFVSAVGSLVLGPLRLSTMPVIRVATTLFVEIIRGPSALVWLFWVFYVLPMFPGVPRLSPTAVGILVLSLIGTAYGSEMVRAGIESVYRGQTDACHALGLSRLQSLRKVVVPQALSQIVPAFGGLAADMVKWTSILSFIGVHDVLYVANNIRSVTFQTVAIFSMLAAFYWIVCFIWSAAFRGIEGLLPLNRALRAAHVSASVRTTSGAQAPAGVSS